MNDFARSHAYQLCYSSISLWFAVWEWEVEERLEQNVRYYWVFWTDCIRANRLLQIWLRVFHTLVLQLPTQQYNNTANNKKEHEGSMFDENKLKQLENKSHVRGKLNKQFYSSQQQELEKKRREMKYILDQQVEEKRRQKQRQKAEQERKLHQQEQRIRNYYAQLEERQGKGQSQVHNNHNPIENGNSQGRYISGNRSIGSGVYESRAYQNQTHPNPNPYHLRENVHNPAIRSKSQTQYEYDSGDIPVMPMMQGSDKGDKEVINNYSIQSGSSSQHNGKERDHKNVHRSSAGNIPLLELTQEEQKREKKKSKRNPTKRDQKEKEKEKEIIKPKPKQKQKERKVTLVDQQLFHHNSRQQTQFKQIFGDLNEELEEQNKQLKKQLKKRQEAISLLMGAVRSNAKLDRFRVQAQKILHNQNSMDTKPVMGSPTDSRARRNSNKNGSIIEENKEKQSMLPKLKLHHQSIMHDYMFGSARRAHVLKSRTFK